MPIIFVIWDSYIDEIVEIFDNEELAKKFIKEYKECKGQEFRYKIHIKVLRTEMP